MNYKEIKKEARKNIKHNYLKNILIIFMSVILLSGGVNISTRTNLNANIQEIKNIEILKKQGKSNSEIIEDLLQKTMEPQEREKTLSKKYTKGIISLIINEITSTKSTIFNFLNGVNELLGGRLSLAIVIILSNAILILFRTIFISVLEVGKNRYFLEQRRYLKTKIDRFLYPYKKRKNFHLAIILFLKNIYLFFWSFTIIGFFIKYYEYKMIPYILAENPCVSKKDVFELSKQMSDGNKFDMFKLDLSILCYKIPGLFTFNLTNIFFTNIYEETLYSEVYINLRRNISSKLLNDKYLDIKECVDSEYPEDKKESLLNANYLKDYSIDTYILFFFTFSIIGWLWEIVLHLIETGNFVNRGTLYGPWLPIYGYGGLAILIFLKKWRNKPLVLFILSVLLCGIIEYGTSLYLEFVNHLKYWDYSGYFLNINGRVCLEGLIIFGMGGCAFTYLFAPILDNFYQKINLKFRTILGVLLIILYAIDMSYSTFVVPNKGEGVSTDIIETQKK